MNPGSHDDTSNTLLEPEVRAAILELRRLEATYSRHGLSLGESICFYARMLHLTMMEIPGIDLK
jgi:hypothetical protein